jgi:peptide/nickel transport system substrate-binding protein
MTQAKTLTPKPGKRARACPQVWQCFKSGALPPVAKRLPDSPLIVTEFAGGDGPGRPGDQLNILVGSERDTRLMTIFSYTRLKD